MTPDSSRPSSRAAITASKASVSLRSSPNETAAPARVAAMSRSAASPLPPASRGRMSTTLRPRYGSRPWSPRRSRASTAAMAASDRRARRGDVVGLADVERDRRALALHEQPRRRAELDHDPGGQRLGVRRVALEPRLRRDRDRAAAAAREARRAGGRGRRGSRSRRRAPARRRRRRCARSGPRPGAASGRAAGDRGEPAQRPAGTRLDPAAPGSREPWDSVPSKSAITRSGGRASTSRSKAAETAAGDEAASAGVAWASAGVARAAPGSRLAPVRAMA